MKTIKEDDRYFVTQEGTVFSKVSGTLRPILGKLDKDGYRVVLIYTDTGRVYRRVHRLVAEAYLPNPEGLPVVNHIDEDKENNSVGNLEWCTVQHNTVHSLKVRKFLIKGNVEEIQSVSQYCRDNNLDRRKFYRIACAI